jgi:6-phosphogluconolactonase
MSRRETVDSRCMDRSANLRESGGVLGVDCRMRGPADHFRRLGVGDTPSRDDMKTNSMFARSLRGSLLGVALLSTLAGCGSGTTPIHTPPPEAAHFAYTSNTNSSSITAYKVESASGALSPVAGSPFGGVDIPLGLAIAPSSDFLAAGNLNGPGIPVFRVDKETGSIASVAASPFPTPGGGFPIESVFHPSGKFLYAGMQVSATSNVWAFSLDASTGGLSPVPGSPFAGQSYPGGGGVNSIALHPTGTFLYASGFFSGITGYTVNSGSGALSQLPGSPFIPAGTFFNSKLVVHPSGKFLYMADLDADGVRVFPIAADGSLGTEITASPFACGLAPRGIALGPGGKFAFVPNEGDQNVTAFSVDSITGALTLVGSADTGNGASAVTLDSSGKFLHVTNFWDANVSTYTVDATTGAMAPVAGSPFAAEDGPSSIVTTK